ncbi:SPOR domain-containing protein [Lysobacter sp. D1-1-M9]|uniref:SPOR domain-containing protein n=1 Tax=Novilysobacter longmucuonensis TaxID=3098603 RepID=UPI002FC720CE
MEPALKQRLIGASVLVALAVIFLPMLIKDPAPESGVSDVPMQLPDPPQGAYETRELPLVTPGAAGADGVTGLRSGQPASGGVLPTIDTTADQAGATGGMMPPPTAGGDHAVSFGSYASASDAERVVDALRASQLPGYQETTVGSGDRTLHRVRIGPYGSRAEAEAARLRAAHVRDDVGARVVTLDAASDTVDPSEGVADATGADEGAAPDSVAKALPEADDSAERVAQSLPAQPSATPAAAADVGFAVQLGAFSNTAEAGKLRDRARAAGFTTFLQTVRTEQGTLTRVVAGPVADRGDAEQMKAQLAARLGVSGLVRSHP